MIMDKKELNYLKEKFLEVSTINYIFRDPLDDLDKNFGNFLNEAKIIREKIHQVENLDDFKAVASDLRTAFFDSFHQSKNEMENKAFMNRSVNYFHKAIKGTLENGDKKFDEWINEQLSIYKNKTLTNFFNKVDTSLKNIFGIPPNLKQSGQKEYLSNHTLNYGRDLLNKYNLSFIDVSSFKTNKEALLFLEKFDSTASETFKNLGTTNDILGIHRTVSLISNGTNEAYYSSANKSISFDTQNLNKR